MRIEELHLQNFRGFRELKLTLSSDLAVFIGVNGSGKSSILDSIAILLSQFVADVSVHYESRLYIEEDDIKITSNEVFLSTRVEVDSNKKLWWEVSQDRKMGMQSTKGDLFNYLLERLLNEVIPIHDDERILQINNKNDLILPIIVFYHTDRILIKSSAIKYMSEEERENTYDNNRLIGYQTAFSGNINDFRDFLYWFKEEEEYENEVRLRQDTNFRNPRLEIIRKALETFLEGFPKDTLSSVINALNKKFPNKTWSKEAIKKKLEELSSKDAEDKYSPYCQYIVWYLSKRLNIP